MHHVNIIQQLHEDACNSCCESAALQGLVQEIVDWCELKANSASSKPATYRCVLVYPLLCVPVSEY